MFTLFSLHVVSVGGTPPDKAYQLIPIPLFAVYTTLAIVGVIFAIVCMVFNIIFWNKV